MKTILPFQHRTNQRVEKVMFAADNSNFNTPYYGKRTRVVNAEVKFHPVQSLPSSPHSFNRSTIYLSSSAMTLEVGMLVDL